MDHDRANVEAGKRSDPEQVGQAHKRGLELIAGRRERLEAKIRHLYGFSPEHVRKEVDDWLRWQVVLGPRGQRQLGRSALASIR